MPLLSYKVIPWTGGINTSVDPGVLNSQELVNADNVIFVSNAARVKRTGLEYLTPQIPEPDFKESNGNTRKLIWRSTALNDLRSPNERLVVNEHISVSNDPDFQVNDVPIDSLTTLHQTTKVICNADIDGSLNETYFVIFAGDSGNGYYVWFNVDGSGVDPQVPGLIGIPVTISKNDSDVNVAIALSSAVNNQLDFEANQENNEVTITATLGGPTTNSSDHNTGFLITNEVEGGFEVTYQHPESVSLPISPAAGLTIERASQVIFYQDYWRFADNATDQQIGVYATNNFQLFTLDNSGRRIQIHGEKQLTKITTKAGSDIETGTYLLLNSANNQNLYYLWFNKGGQGGDPMLSGRTGIEVEITENDTDAEVASAIVDAFNGITDFEVSSSDEEVEIECVVSGITDDAIDVTSGLTVTTEVLGATTPINPVNSIRGVVFNERLILAFSGLGNKMIVFNPDENEKYRLLAKDSPDASFLFEYQGRLWTNDKTNRDLLHYSQTFDETIWLGHGDSGALPIKPGDGDPKGITNAYEYKNLLIVAKQSKRYRVVGESPETYYVETISNGLGNEGPLAVSVDDADVIFVSRRGFHSQQVTDQYGDLDAAYLSRDIKGSFNSFERDHFPFMQGAYIPELNSVAFSVAEEGSPTPNSVWLYNFEVPVPGKDRTGAWYRWPNISCTALSRQFINGTYKLIFGTAKGEVVRAQRENTFRDFNDQGIEFYLKTGTIYPGDDPQVMKAFKKISVIYRPKGNFTFFVRATIDNHISQGFAFNQISGLDLLGINFVLGHSLLGSSNTLAPFTFSMDGYGRGITLEVIQGTPNEQVEIWGFIIEYEIVDNIQETI